MITDADELLFRQVNPNWIREGRVSSQAFRPMPKDEGLLSVDRGSMTTPEASFRLLTEGVDAHVRRHLGGGRWGVHGAGSCGAGGSARLATRTRCECGARRHFLHIGLFEEPGRGQGAEAGAVRK